MLSLYEFEERFHDVFEEICSPCDTNDLKTVEYTRLKLSDFGMEIFMRVLADNGDALDNYYGRESSLESRTKCRRELDDMAPPEEVLRIESDLRGVSYERCCDFFVHWTDCIENERKHAKT